MTRHIPILVHCTTVAKCYGSVEGSRMTVFQTYYGLLEPLKVLFSQLLLDGLLFHRIKTLFDCFVPPSQFITSFADDLRIIKDVEPVK